MRFKWPPFSTSKPCRDGRGRKDGDLKVAATSMGMTGSLNSYRNTMDKNIKLKIIDVVYPGKGLARLDGCVVFIRGVLPGEVVTARIIKQRKNYAEAELINIDEPSPFRIEPICPLARTCPDVPISR